MTHIDQDILLRFAEWLVAHEASHSAFTLLKSVQSKSPIIGARLRGADQGTREAFEEDFSTEERAAVLALMSATPETVSWEPSADATRQRRRASALDHAAQRLGFDTWRRFETAVINAAVEIEIKRKS